MPDWADQKWAVHVTLHNNWLVTQYAKQYGPLAWCLGLSSVVMGSGQS